MRQLLGASKGKFKVTEPLIYDNKLSVAGAPLSTFMTFDGFDDILVPFDSWRSQSKQGPQNRENVFILDLYEIPDKERPPCPITEKSHFCYQMSTILGERRFVIAFKEYAMLKSDGFSTIFSLIRQANNIPADSIVTLGLYFLWYHPLADSKLMQTSHDDFLSIQIAPYLEKAVDYFTENCAKKTIDLAIGWRIQRQFSTSVRNIVKSDLDMNPDKGGFVVGCQLGHIMKTLRRKDTESSATLLIFDIFANNGGGADRNVGPTRVVRRQIVRAFKTYFKNVVVVESLLRKLSAAEITKNMDPLQIYKNDPETFIVWLEMALGKKVESFVNAGGHFADAIAEFRSNKGILEVLHPEFCNPASVNWETGETVENDDLAKSLFGPQST
jgi:hypothetical protein